MSHTKTNQNQGGSIGPTLMLASAAVVAAAVVSPPTLAAEESTNVTEDGVIKLAPQTVEGQRETVATPGGNPYADADAPYKIDRSANSKFTEPLLNISKTINVIGKDQLKDSNTSALKELMTKEPGITLGTGEGGNALGDRFFIRGFDARNDVFVDGVRSPGVTSRALFATEQVEISKGPSSTFAGRGTTGGSINSISKQPQQTNFFDVGLMLGDEQRATLDVNRVINDKLSVRANLMVQESDISGNENRPDKKQGIQLVADYVVTDEISFLFDYYYLNGDSTPDYGHPWDSVNDQPFEVDPSVFYGVSKRDFHDTSANVFTGTFNYDFGVYSTITSRTRIGQTTNDYVVGAPEFNGVDAAGGSFTAPTGQVFSKAKTAGFTNKIIANNTQFKSERYIYGKEHIFSVGFEVSKEEITNRPYDNTFGSVLLEINNPDNNAGSGSVNRRTGSSLVEATSTALYAMDTVKLSPKWQAFGGLRYDYFNIENTGFDYSTGTTTDTVFYDRGYVNGHFGITFKPVESSSVYAAVSTSSNLPGEMYDGVSSVDYGGLVAGLEDVEPEENINFEVGIKREVANGDLLLGAGLFHMTKSNRVENAAGFGEPVDVRQTAEIQVQGLEFNVSGKINPKLSVTGGISIMDTQIKRSVILESVGQKLANVAERSASLQLKYQVTPKFALGGSAVHTGEILGGTLAATSGNSLDASNRIDLMAEYKFNNKLSLQANVKNVTDDSIYTTLYRSSEPFTYVSPSRTFNLGVNYKF